MPMTRRRFGAAAAAIACAAIPSARAQSAMVLASGYPEQNYHTRTLRWFADEVRRRTGGAAEITIHSNGSLLRLPEIKRGVQTGQIQLGEILLGNHGNEDAIFEADSVPFLARGFEEARKLYDAQRPMLEQRFGRQNMLLLYSVVWPGNGVFSRRPLERLADMAGMRFRAYNALTAKLAEQLGAHPVTVQVPELAMAFTTGVAEVMVASSPVVVNTRGWDFGRYYYDVRAFNPRNAVVANARAFRALPEAQREAILAAAAEAERRGWEAAVEDEARNLGLLAENGMEVVRPGPEMVREMEAVGEALISGWAERAGPDGAALRRAVGR